MNSTTLQINDDSISQGDYFGAIRRRYKTIVVTFTIILSLVVTWNFMATPIYKASSRILVEMDERKILSFADNFRRDLRLPEFTATHKTLIKSFSVLKKTVAMLELEKKVGYGVPRPRNSIRNFFWTAYNIAFDWVNSGQVIKLVPSSPQVNLPEYLAISEVKKRLNVSGVRGTGVINISFEDADPKIATKIVNTLTGYYLDMEIGLRLSVNKNASAWLKTEILKAGKILETSERSLQNYGSKNKFTSPEDRQSIMFQKLREISSAVTTARNERISLEIFYREAIASNGNNGGIIIVPQVAENETLQRFNGQRVTLLREYSSLSKRYKDRHPRMASLLSSIKLMDEKIHKETNATKQRIIARYRIAKENEHALEKNLDEHKKEVARINWLAIQHRTLKRDVDTNRKVYENLLSRQKETTVLSAFKSSSIRIVDKARLPQKPIRPNKTLNLLLGVIASLLFSLTLAFIIDARYNPIRTPGDVERIAGVSMLGSLKDFGKKVSKYDPLLRLGNQEQAIGREFFRGIRTTALNRLGNEYQVIQITSCIPSEGKSFVASNLAESISSSGKKVLLIDGDLKRQSLKSIFGLEASPGLIDIISDNAQLSDSIIRIHPNQDLDFLPAGRLFGEATKILTQEKLKETIDKLKPWYDFVIIDTPPILAVSHPLIWAAHVDCIFFVVDVKQVNSYMLNQSIKILKEIGTPILGTILNRISKSNIGLYHYGYDKKYNVYYRDEDK